VNPLYEEDKFTYYLLWIWVAPLFCLVWPFFFLVKGWQWTRSGWLRDWEDFVDDPVDDLKEWLHCHPLLFGYQLNISFLMQHRKTTWDIIRKDGDYENCDPED